MTERRRSARTLALGLVALILMSGTAVLMLTIGTVTLFRAPRFYARMARWLCLAILRLYGVRIQVIGPAFPPGQVVYVSNHTSTLDLFVLVALGLPNCRFFLSGFLRKLLPLGAIAWMMGTFFTVPQNRSDERRRIFARAAQTLRRTGESVYLSPEGGRITTGEIGPFNKGAFHLATALGAPIVPLYFVIPRAIDPGRGYDARPGIVTVHVLEAIDTSSWTVERLPIHREDVRDVFVRVHEEMRCA